MAKREYNGQPIDLTDFPGETHLRQINDNGETVAGTTKDDYGNESTVFLPHDVSPEDIPEKQWEAIQVFQIEGDRDDPNPWQLAKDRDFSGDVARAAIHRVFRDTRGIEDISPSYRLSVFILAYEGTEESLTDLEEKYPVSRRALAQARDVYPDLIDEYSDISKSELEKAVSKYKETKHQGIAKNGTDDSEGAKDSNQSEDASVYQTPKDEKEYPDDFTETYQWFIEKISDHPSKTKQEIEELIPQDKGFSGQNYYNTVRNYPGVIKTRILEKETATTQSDLSDYLQKHIDLSDGEEDTDQQEQESTDNDDSSADNDDNDQFEARLRSVESKVETLRQQIGEDNTHTDNERVELATIIVESIPDEELGRLIRESFQDETGGSGE